MNVALWSSFVFCFIRIHYALAVTEKNCSPRPSEPATLQLVHVLFRHGDRTPDLEERYPQDPYKNLTYFPFGTGQLTNAGKNREYNIGTTLRKRYDKFLGKHYYPEDLDTDSTDVNRTKMSLTLVLAGLYPPVGVEVWKKDLNWQPIPINYKHFDPVLGGRYCPTFDKYQNQYLLSQKYLQSIEKYKETFEYISKHSGLENDGVNMVYELFFGLTAERAWGLKLPKWTKLVFPKPITTIAIRQYFNSMATTKLRSLATGYLFQKIINDTQNKINGSNSLRKIYLYSAHENNIAQALIGLDIFEPQIPPYGSYVLFEVHKINKIYGFKIYYQNYSTADPILMKIPKCDKFCPFNKFRAILKDIMPSPNDCFK